MSLTPTVHQITHYTDRYAAALYIGGSGQPPRNGLNFRQSYAGRILSGDRFHVLRPDRLCSLSEFAGFVLVSRTWASLNEVERALLVMTYSQKTLKLASLATKWSPLQCQDATLELVQDGYLRWAEPDVVELTLVGEAEVAHQIGNTGAGESVIHRKGGIRLWHHSLEDHEVELGRESTLSVTVDGMLVRIFTLKDSGTVIRVDHHPSQHVYTHILDRDRGFAQTYIDLSPARINPPLIRLENDHE
jgi:hypothetical protein